MLRIDLNTLKRKNKELTKAAEDAVAKKELAEQKLRDMERQTITALAEQATRLHDAHVRHIEEIKMDSDRFHREV